MKITVNGESIEVPDGSSVSVSNGNVIISGSTRFTYRDEVRVDIVGNCGAIQTVSGDVNVRGDAGAIQTVSGDVTCGRVSGTVKTVSGDIRHVY